jgi:hypothetical protein
MERELKKPDTNTMDKLKKVAMPAMIAIFGIGAALILTQMMFPPKAGKAPTPVMEEVVVEQVSNNDLEINSLNRRVAALEENIKKIYANQVELNKSISEMLKAEELTKKTNKENRAYIAMMYQKVLDIELRVENGLGGGFNVRPKPQEETVNPLIGTGDTLPEPVPPSP